MLSGGGEGGEGGGVEEQGLSYNCCKKFPRKLLFYFRKQSRQFLGTEADNSR
jgi:hypothetical protein